MQYFKLKDWLLGLWISVVDTIMFNINLVPKWHFDVDIHSSVDPTKCILKLERGGSQDNFWPHDQVVKRDGWVVMELVLFINCQVVKWASILLDRTKLNGFYNK